VSEEFMKFVGGLIGSEALEKRQVTSVVASNSVVETCLFGVPFVAEHKSETMVPSEQTRL
jgi:hypothetical protein